MNTKAKAKDNMRHSLWKHDATRFLLHLCMILSPGIVHGLVPPTPRYSFNVERLARMKEVHDGLTNETLGNRLPICVNHPDWTGQGIVAEDCQIVIDRVYDHYKDHFWIYYQFISPYGMPMPIKPVLVPTPIKVSYGTLDPDK